MKRENGKEALVNNKSNNYIEKQGRIIFGANA